MSAELSFLWRLARVREGPDEAPNFWVQWPPFEPEPKAPALCFAAVVCVHYQRPLYYKVQDLFFLGPYTLELPNHEWVYCHHTEEEES